VIAPLTTLHVNHPNTGGIGLSVSNTNNNSYRWTLYTSSATNTPFRLYYDGALKGAFSAADGSYSASSDRNLKTNIIPTGSLLSKVIDLQVVEYNMVGQNEAKKHLGLIAQDVEKLFPSIITPAESNEEGDSHYLMNYSLTGVIAIKAIQEQQVIIESLKQTIDELKNRLETMERKTNKE
jgi:hypothetical protein